MRTVCALRETVWLPMRCYLLYEDSRGVVGVAGDGQEVSREQRRHKKGLEPPTRPPCSIEASDITAAAATARPAMATADGRTRSRS